MKADSSFIESAQRSLSRCDTLASISSMEGAVCRIYLSPEHRQCNDTVRKWMDDANMLTWEDSVGNCWGRYAADREDAPSIILGSHLDTVPNAGKYDGILGVISAIEVVDRLAKSGIKLPFHIDVVGFGDEEGVRYGATLIGSRAVAGTWDPAWVSLSDNDNIPMGKALLEFKGAAIDPLSASMAKDKVLAYLELHIEQGPVLEQQNSPVGVVSAIAGARRFRFTCKGIAGHAGTVPMGMRRDALVGAARAITAIEAIAGRSRVVATVGKIEAYPGSVNVIPGECKFTLDIRSGVDSTRDHAVTTILEEIDDIADELELQFTYEEFHNAAAVSCDSELQRQIEEAVSELGIEPLSLVSGAGHDAMAVAEIAPVGMIFVRCKGGISHHPAEAVTEHDVAWGIQVFYHSLLKVIENYKQL